MTTPLSVRVGTGAACGSCGELVQGVLPDGMEFQVTLPIDRFSFARVRVTESADWAVGVTPPDRTKAAAAALATARFIGSPPLRIAITVDGDLPIGVGLGSSTADVVAAVRATAAALAASLTPHETGSIAGAIEPTDGTMHAGMCVTDRRGGLLEAWSWTPTFHVVILVPEGEGVATDEVSLEGQQDSAAAYARLLDDLRHAVRRRDPQLFADAAVTSAALHAAVRPNPLVALAPALAHETGAAGWNVAHTGTAVGLLFFESRRADQAAATASSDARLTGITAMRATALTGPHSSSNSATT